MYSGREKTKTGQSFPTNLGESKRGPDQPKQVQSIRFDCPCLLETNKHQTGQTNLFGTLIQTPRSRNLAHQENIRKVWLAPINQAGEGNRTLVVGLGSRCSTIELHPLVPEIPVYSCSLVALWGAHIVFIGPFNRSLGRSQRPGFS